MNEVDNILSKISHNQVDLYNQILFLKRLIEQHRVNSVFINYSNEGFLCNYVKSKISKITFNSINDKHYKEYGSFSKVKYVNKKLEKIMIQNYDMYHWDSSQNFDDWCEFVRRMLRIPPKFIILSNTKINVKQTACIIDCIFKKKYEIIKMFDDYFGCVVLKLIK